MHPASGACPQLGGKQSAAADEGILVVDDDRLSRTMLVRLLESEGYRCGSAGDGEEARARLERERFGVALVDVMMPGESGLELVGGLLARHRDLAVVMVTGVDDPRIAQTAFEDGAYGYVVKPFRASEVLISVANAFRRRTLEQENRAQQRQLEQRVRERTAHLADALDRLRSAEGEARRAAEVTVGVLARAIEHRDEETSAHVERMGRYAELIAEGLGFDAERCALVRIAAPMHDIGKVAVPDGILFKPGPLSAAEFDVIKMHAARGAEILGKSDVELLSTAAVMARTHHERWNGTGYPDGLAGEEIPIEGRIAAVADVFDAILSRRVYKPAWTFDAAVAFLRREAGEQFDPAVVEVFLSSIEDVAEIQREHVDA